MEKTNSTETVCYHCGDSCTTGPIKSEDKNFCCQGCLLVYELLAGNNLCTYYDLNKNPGQAIKIQVRKDKFSYLEDEDIEKQLLSFADETQKHVTLHLPSMHCSSCLYLLENLSKLAKGVIRSEVNFPRKDIEIVFDPKQISLRRIAEVLTGIGYEPYISLNDLGGKKPGFSKHLIYKVGIAGFCFGNIMLISFAEYLGLDESDQLLQNAFRIFSLILSLPVVIYSATPFYKAAWGGLKNKIINIDAPIVLAVWVTFARSVYEMFSGIGSGYFDSLTGIVFFMLIGRILQERTHKKLSFDRDYSSYFPIAVSIVEGETVVPKQLPKIKVGDTMLIHNEELIPADGILTKGKAWIDYSFVTGESVPVVREMGEMIYAGGKQVGTQIELLVIKEVSQSYLTKLWDNEKDARNQKETQKQSFVDAISRYFTLVLFIIAISAFSYWFVNDSSKMWQVFTAVLIIACPCALLLSNTFTNGHILRILSNNGFFLKNARVIENIAKANYLVFDKTGTLTVSSEKDIDYNGYPLSDEQKGMVKALAAQSTHPLSVALNHAISRLSDTRIIGYKEHPGFGIEGFCDDTLVSLGSQQFVRHSQSVNSKTPQVHLAIENRYFGFFSIKNHYREGLKETVQKLAKRFGISVMSGDNTMEEGTIREIFGYDVPLYFNQKPHDKVENVKKLQNSGKRVIMIGDGLNDSSALLSSSVGIAITDNTNNFTPASDAILDAASFAKLPAIIELCKSNKKIVMASFILSIVYNIFGIGFAVSGNLSPLVAAVLMPLSSISILILSYTGSLLLARKSGLNS
jgi:Cu+-exporting ATPase